MTSESLFSGKTAIGPVMDAKTLAKQNAKIATMNITKTLAERLAKNNTFKKFY